MLPAFSLLRRLKFLRGTKLDLFGYTAERRTERELIAEYEGLVEELLGRLAAENHALAVELASLPDGIRGYGDVKEANLEKVRHKWADLLARYRGQQRAQVIRMPVRAA